MAGVDGRAREVAAAMERFADRCGDAWAEEYLARVTGGEDVTLADFFRGKARELAAALVSEAIGVAIRQAAEDARTERNAELERRIRGGEA